MQEFLWRLKQILQKYKEGFVREIIREFTHFSKKKNMYIFLFQFLLHLF